MIHFMELEFREEGLRVNMLVNLTHVHYYDKARGHIRIGSMSKTLSAKGMKDLEKYILEKGEN